jgi:hypothetical protein
VTAYEGADGNGSTMVDPEDYDVWSEHFGRSASSGAGAMAESTDQALTYDEHDSALLAALIEWDITSRRAKLAKKL